MGTLTSLFDLTRTALSNDQAALNATANNVANQNTTGYTRKVVSFSAGDSVTISNGSVVSISQPGVKVASLRDRVLEQRVQQQTQVASASSAQAAALAQVESVFSLTGSSATAGATQIGTAIDSFFSAATALAAAPSDAATKQGVLSAAGALASSFQSAATQLGQVTAAVAGEIRTSIPQVNALAASIAKLNAQITANSPGVDAGALEDQRQAAIAQLSQYVGLTQVTNESNGISLTTQGGTVLVSGGSSNQLTAVSTNSGTTIHDGSGADVSGTIQGGSLGGQLTAQNVTLPGVTASLDAVAYRVGTAVNTINSAGVGGGPIFSLPATAAGAAATISLLPGAIVAGAAVGEGSTGNTNALALEDLGTATDASGTTIAGQFAALLSQVGTQSAAVQEASATDTASLAQLTTQRDALSGVSLDDEAASLSQYQRSYQAAAKVLSVLDQLLAAAINIGTQTSVS